MKNIVINFLKTYLLKAMTGLAGWRLLAAKLLSKYLLKKSAGLIAWAQEQFFYLYTQMKNKAAKKSDEKKAGKFEDTLKDGVTEDAQHDAATDLLNGGRKL